MRFLGTGAAELVPNPFCNCPVCQRARAMGQKPRKRSCFLVDAHTMIDFGPDCMAASMQYDAPLYDLDHIFITHTHIDHLSLTNLLVLTMTPTRRERTLHVHLSQAGYDYLLRNFTATADFNSDAADFLRLMEQKVIALEVMPPEREIAVGDWKVLAVHSNHHGTGEGEFALNYRLTRPDGFRLHYAADTGLYNPHTLEALRDSRLDLLVMEGTSSNYDYPRDAGHLNAPHFVENLQNMLDYGILHAKSRVYVTHINQVGTFNHEEYQAWMDKNAPIPVTVAWDGLELDAQGGLF